MCDAASCTHNLNVTSFCAALIAKAILMSNRAFAHISNDLHVIMAMGGKALTGFNLIIIPNPDGAPLVARRIAVAAEREMMTGIQPAVLKLPKTGVAAFLDHILRPFYNEDVTCSPNSSLLKVVFPLTFSVGVDCCK